MFGKNGGFSVDKETEERLMASANKFLNKTSSDYEKMACENRGWDYSNLTDEQLLVIKEDGLAIARTFNDKSYVNQKARLSGFNYDISEKEEKQILKYEEKNEEKAIMKAFKAIKKAQAKEAIELRERIEREQRKSGRGY